MSEKDCSRSGNDRAAELEETMDELSQILSKHGVTYGEWIDISIAMKRRLRF